MKSSVFKESNSSSDNQVIYKEAEVIKPKDSKVKPVIIFDEKRKEEKNYGEKTKGFFHRVKDLFRHGNRIRILVTKNQRTLANIPINYGIVFLIFGFHLMLLTLCLIFITGGKVSIQR